MVRNHLKKQPYVLQGGAEAEKPQASTQKAAGAAKRSETILKISHMCFRGARKRKSCKLPLKNRGSSQMVRNHFKNQPYVLQGGAEA